MQNAALLCSWTQPPPLALLVDRDAGTRKMYADYLRLSGVRHRGSRGRPRSARQGHRHASQRHRHRNPACPASTASSCAISCGRIGDTIHSHRHVTGDGFEANIDLAKRVGADSVLVKPCLPETLLAEISKLLDQSFGLRERGRAARCKMHEQIERSDRLIERSHANMRRVTLSRAHARHDTTAPPIAPPTPRLSRVRPAAPLRREAMWVASTRGIPSNGTTSNVSSDCGTFQYRQRTRKLRRARSMAGATPEDSETRRIHVLGRLGRNLNSRR